MSTSPNSNPSVSSNTVSVTSHNYSFMDSASQHKKAISIALWCSIVASSILSLIAIYLSTTPLPLLSLMGMRIVPISLAKPGFLTLSCATGLLFLKPNISECLEKTSRRSTDSGYNTI